MSKNKNGDMGLEYFTKTGKSFSTFKNMPESFKIILNNMQDGDMMSAFSIMHMYNFNKQDAKNEAGEDLKLRTKKIREIYKEVVDLHIRGFLDKIVINDLILNKIKTLQGFVDD